jgi:hypothetical protein
MRVRLQLNYYSTIFLRRIRLKPNKEIDWG